MVIIQVAAQHTVFIQAFGHFLADGIGECLVAIGGLAAGSGGQIILVIVDRIEGHGAVRAIGYGRNDLAFAVQQFKRELPCFQSLAVQGLPGFEDNAALCLVSVDDPGPVPADRLLRGDLALGVVAPLIFLKGNNSEADHLRRTACNGRTTCKSCERKSRTDSRRRDRKCKCHTNNNRNENTHKKRLKIRSPHYEIADCICALTDRRCNKP